MKKLTSSFFAIFLLTINAGAQLTVSVTPTPNNPCDTCMNLSANVSGGTAPFTYQWTLNSQPFATGQNTIYCNKYPWTFASDSITLLVTDGSSQQATCFATPGTFMSSANTGNQSLCIVSVDSATNKNLLIWEQSGNPSIASYHIYKQNTASAWVLLATVPRTGFSTYVDMASNPAQSSNFYNISAVDSCGFESISGIPINTIHLMISAGIPPTWNLNWNWTQGYPITKYRIWRSTTTSSPVLIDSVANTVFSYTDLTPPSNVSKYIVQAVSTVACNPSLKLQNIFSTYSSSLSNFANTNSSGVNEINNSISISVSPNPFSMQAVLQTNYALNNATLEVYNLYGQAVTRIENISTQTIVLHRDNIPSGLYFIQLTQANKILATDKLVITDK